MVRYVVVELDVFRLDQALASMSLRPVCALMCVCKCFLFVILCSQVQCSYIRNRYPEAACVFMVCVVCVFVVCVVPAQLMLAVQGTLHPKCPVIWVVSVTAPKSVPRLDILHFAMSHRQ